MTNQHWTKTIEFDPESGDYVIDINEACNKLGWAVGDVIVWSDNKDGSWTVRKKDETIGTTDIP
jgi:hypothetical protein